MTEDLDKLEQAITQLIPKLLTTLEAFEQVQRNLHPPHTGQLVEFIKPFGDALILAFDQFKQLSFPTHLAHFETMINDACTYTLRAYAGLKQYEDNFSNVMKAMRAHCKAQEAIYPLASVLTPVNQYFLEPKVRGNKQLLQQLVDAMQQAEPEKAGLLCAQNERDKRGGFSAYVPENLDRPTALVVALHGGTGHGADFLWSWVREARSRGFIVIAPTSQQDTWSLMGEEHDLAALLSTIKFVQQNWQIDADHILLSGMSDGATYALMAACQENSPFTHIAPFSGVLHPDLATTGNLRHAIDKPVYLVHGTEDWMFPVETARLANEQLTSLGVDVTYREIPGQSHSFARAELPALLEWFDPSLGAVAPKK
ncbi:MAG: dienelactone hydrolase family protein [Pseudomonadales bacterium]|nr:dienelactone hydrolase family protein [Pseudomonadales bacterium]